MTQLTTTNPPPFTASSMKSTEREKYLKIKIYLCREDNMKQRYYTGYNQVLFLKTQNCAKKLDGRVRTAV